MRTLDRYIVREVSRPLVATLLIALGALLLERLVRLLDLLVNEGGPLNLVLQMLVNLVPHYVGIAVPAAFFVAVLMGVMRLVRDSELDALHAFGIGLPQLLRPIMWMALALTVVTAITFTVLQPYTRYAYRELLHTALNTAVEAALARGGNFTQVEGRTVMVKQRSGDARSYAEVFVHQIDEEGREILVTGEEGALLTSRQDGRLVMRLSDGQRIEIPETGGEAKVVTFDQLDQPFNEQAIGGFRDRGRDERELTLFELFSYMMGGEGPNKRLTYERMSAEFHGRVARTLLLPVLPFLAIPLGLASRRSGRGAGLVAGLVFLLSFHYLLQIGENLGHDGHVPPWLGVWAPFTVFTLISFWVFRTAATRPDAAIMNSVLETMSRIGSIFRRRRRGTAGAR